MGIRHALSMKMAQNTAEMAQLSSAIPHRAIHKPFPYGQSQIRYLFSVALKRAGLTVNDLDVIEANEAFAAQACAVTRDLGLDPAKVNPNGSGISLGHPIGATGALITVKALHELQRIQGRYALVTMCIGGGQGIAAIFERM